MTLHTPMSLRQIQRWMIRNSAPDTWRAVTHSTITGQEEVLDNLTLHSLAAIAARMMDKLILVRHESELIDGCMWVELDHKSTAAAVTAGDLIKHRTKPATPAQAGANLMLPPSPLDCKDTAQFAIYHRLETLEATVSRLVDTIAILCNTPAQAPSMTPQENPDTTHETTRGMTPPHFATQPTPPLTRNSRPGFPSMTVP